jgi:hypothetical protein
VGIESLIKNNNKDMKLQGRVKKLMDVRSGVSRVGNAWKAQDFIFEYFDNDAEQYAETVLLNVRGDKIEELSLHEGDEIEVDLRCTVRSYGDRLYNEPYARNVVVVKSQWKKEEEAQALQPTTEQKDAMEKLNKLAEETASGKEGGSEDELPF